MIPKLMFVLLAAVTVLLSLSADQGKSLSSIFKNPFTRKVYLYLTNKEASTVLCSVVKHAGSG